MLDNKNLTVEQVKVLSELDYQTQVALWGCHCASCPYAFIAIRNRSNKSILLCKSEMEAIDKAIDRPNCVVERGCAYEPEDIKSLKEITTNSCRLWHVKTQG